MFRPITVGLVLELVLNPSQGSPTQNEMIGKIVGGVRVDMKKFPHSVQIFNTRKDNNQSSCGGSILNAYTVLSAAHCFDVNQNASLIQILAGSRFSYDKKGSSHRGQLLVMHERYILSKKSECNIALVFLINPITFSKVVQKAVIVDTGKWMNEIETNFSIAGWGRTDYHELPKRGQQLSVAKMRYIAKKRCQKSYILKLTEDTFCLSGDGKQGACKGDSGGGVMWRGMIVGIVLHGVRCSAYSPAVFTNVWYFRDWIKKHIDKFGDNYCEIKNMKRDTTDDVATKES